MRTAGLRVPASDPAASPSSRRSKLKGRFMLSDPWGGGRLSAGIEAWHGSALLCSHCLSWLGCWPWGCWPCPALRPGAALSWLRWGSKAGAALWALVGLAVSHVSQGREAAPHSCRRAGPAVAVAGEGRVRWSCLPCLLLPALPAPAGPTCSCLPCLPLTSDHGSEAATGERLHQPRCGKMVSVRSRSRSGSALSPGTLRPGA